MRLATCSPEIGAVRRRVLRLAAIDSRTCHSNLENQSNPIRDGQSLFTKTIWVTFSMVLRVGYFTMAV